MNILYLVTKIAIGGTEAVVRDLAAHAKKHGHHVVIMTFLKSANHMVDAIKHHNIHLISFPSANPFSIRNVMFLLHHLKHGAYDMIHAHTEEAHFYLSILSLIFTLPAPIVMTEHYYRYQNVRFNPMRRFMYQRYKKVICVSTEISHFLSHHVKRLHDRCVVVHNGIDLTKYQPLLTTTSKQPLRIVCTARLVKQKDLATAITALTYCQTPFHLLIIGDGKLHQQLSTLITRLELTNQVSLLGWCDDIPTQLQSADIYVQSSVWEGCSIAILEAMRAGLPLIVSHATGLLELVGDAALTFPIGNAKALAHHLDTLSQNPNLRYALSQRSLSRVQQFSLHTTWEKHFQLYQDVMTTFRTLNLTRHKEVSLE